MATALQAFVFSLCFVHIFSVKRFYLYSNNTGNNVIVSPVLRNDLGGWVAMSITEDYQNQTGWGFLEVYTSASYPDIWQAYGAGIVESFPQQHGDVNLIAMHMQNTLGSMCSTPLSPFCSKLRKYLETNFEYMYEQIIRSSSTDPYWHQVELFLVQVRGLIDGYDNNTSSPSYIIKDVLHPLVLMQLGGDMEDLESALTGKSTLKGPLGSGSCSALVKLLDNSKDIYVSQDTWNGFESLLRYLKKYQFNYHETESSDDLIAGNTMTFSSYPGILTSGDDFYTISSGLVTLETTIGNGNSSLWKYITPEGTVLEPIRSMVANRLATSGKQWCDTFSQRNSGTYNNQWMIVDYKLFKAGSLPPMGTLYVLEQIPGIIEYRDNTDILIKQGYWPSYNVASFAKIFNASGQPAMVQKYGDWFSYDHTARANIFRRDHVKVKDLDSMLRLMRYNDFTHDPLSACNCTPPYSAENAISARSDLNPANGTYPFGALGHRAHGGTDSKITTSELFRSLQFLSVSSPTYDNVPPFQWSKSDFKDKLSHIGHPDLWAFKPFVHKWSCTR